MSEAVVKVKTAEWNGLTIPGNKRKLHSKYLICPAKKSEKGFSKLAFSIVMSLKSDY